MDVHTRSGDVDLTLPPGAKFDLRASTEHGDVNNEYGDALHEDNSGHGGTLAGGTGGLQVRLETGRGSITIRKANGDETTTFPEIPNAPNAPKAPKPPNPPELKVERQ